MNKRKIKKAVRDVGEKEFGENIRKVKEASLNALETARDNVLEAEEKLEKSMKKHPLGAVLVAAGVGIVIGSILRRKKRW